MHCHRCWIAFTSSLVVWLISSQAIGEPANASSANGQPTAGRQHVANESITAASLRAHIRFLADDLLEGRGPGSRGDDLSQRYIATQFEMLGLQPAAPGGEWFQSVPLVGITTHAPQSLTFKNGDRSLSLKGYVDYMVSAGKPVKQVGFENAELVFVGYGIEAPEFDWDDFKDLDVRGKLLLFMNNDPSSDPSLFAGRRRLYYGRWDYKYAMAARRGAVGAMIIHTTPSAGYPYQVVQTSWSGEQFQLRSQAGPQLKMSGWVKEEAAGRLAKLSGMDLDQLRASAERRDFRPVALGTTMSISMTCDVHNKDTGNVLAVLPGSDPELSKEMVIFMAHHDHIGLAAARDQRGDNIYNGAVDNASGVAAMLSIAKACANLAESEWPRRSILFAAVGAEEQGLLGSKYLALHPPVAPGYLAAILNIDGINIIGPTRDVNIIGHGKSNMDNILQRIAKWQGRVVTPDQFPDRGYYYRSDQFSLAQVGVPGVYLHSGIHVIGKPDGWGKRQLEEWIETKYHQTSDEYSDDWDLRGAVLDAKLLFFSGLQVASQRALPAWNRGDEFEAARQTALESRTQ